MIISIEEYVTIIAYNNMNSRYLLKFIYSDNHFTKRFKFTVSSSKWDNKRNTDGKEPILQPIFHSYLTLYILYCFDDMNMNFAFHFITPHWNSTGNWNPSLWKIRTYLHVQKMYKYMISRKWIAAKSFFSDRIQIKGLVQDCSNSIASAMELLQSSTEPLINAREKSLSKMGPRG